MAESKIPESIKHYKPGPCTEIKLINGHYHVYMYGSKKLKTGEWEKKTGKTIGKKDAGTGFIPNKNYHLYISKESQEEITVLEYGQYALVEIVAKSILSSLKQCFPEDRAAQVFACACIIFVNDFFHVDQVQAYYEQSWPAQEYKNLPFRMAKPL